MLPADGRKHLLALAGPSVENDIRHTLEDTRERVGEDSVQAAQCNGLLLLVSEYCPACGKRDCSEAVFLEDSGCRYWCCCAGRAQHPRVTTGTARKAANGVRT